MIAHQSALSASLLANAVVVLGAGRQAVETAGYLAEAGIEVAAHVEERAADTLPPGSGLDAAILMFGEDDARLQRISLLPALSAVGTPAVRHRLIARWAGNQWMTLVSKHAWVSRDAEVGDGSTIAPLAAVNRTARIGRHVLLNVGAIVSHDVVVEDFVTIGPGCSIGGGTLICTGAFIGIGATVRDRVRIGRDAVVAAGAVVVADVADGSVVVGVPARPIRKSR